MKITSSASRNARLTLLASVSASALALGLFGTQTAGCSNSDDSDDDGADSGGDAGFTSDGAEPGDDANVSVPDASVNCTVNGTDPVSFCLQKSILKTEHTLFNAKTGMPASWDAVSFLPTATDGGVTVHDVRDDLAYGASLSTYYISEIEYGDNQLASMITTDLMALAPLVQTELATLPATYDGEVYLRLRRLAQGLTLILDTADATKISAIADAYGRAIYTTYFHPLTAVPIGTIDAGALDGAAGDGAADDGGSDDAATTDAGLDSAAPTDDAGPLDAGDAGDAGLGPIGDGIVGTPATGGGFAYDVDQAASAALALLDMANRHATDDAADSTTWARASGSIFTHLYTRARHASGLYYSYLVTSADPGHDALDTVLTPNDTLLTETQASVIASLLRANGILGLKTVTALASLDLGSYVVLPLNALQGTPSLWDPVSNTATTAACATISPTNGGAAPACGGSGFFLRDLPSDGGVDTTAKTIRGNALLFAAIHRALVSGLGALPASGGATDGGIVPLIDYEPLVALFTTQTGTQVSFLTQNAAHILYPAEVNQALAFVTGNTTYTAQANAYAIEALNEQWVLEPGCPIDFY